MDNVTPEPPGPVERVDQRSSVFSRSLLGEFGEELEREFKRMTVRYRGGLERNFRGRVVLTVGGDDGPFLPVSLVVFAIRS